jgi:hypothetical protein
MCFGPDVHEAYAGRDRFAWSRPKLTTYRTVAPDFVLAFNRYPHHVIGAYVNFRRRAVSLTWKGSRRG